jgi:hypothetical protein
LEGFHISPVCPSDKTNVLKTAWSIGAMILTMENGSTTRKTCSTVKFSTTNFTWTDLESNSDLRVEKAADKLPEPWHGSKTKVNPF